jgi:hypothetical protein
MAKMDWAFNHSDSYFESKPWSDYDFSKANVQERLGFDTLE